MFSVDLFFFKFPNCKRANKDYSCSSPSDQRIHLGMEGETAQVLCTSNLWPSSELQNVDDSKINGFNVTKTLT